LTVSVDNFILFFHHEILKYVSTFSHSARSMNWHARTCFRRRISRKTRTKKFLEKNSGYDLIYKSPNIGVKNFSPVGPIDGFHKSLNVEHCIFYLKCLLKRLATQCSELNQDEVCSLRTNESKEDSKHQNKHDLWFGF
jgi:hypothetical protein